MILLRFGESKKCPFFMRFNALHNKKIDYLCETFINAENSNFFTIDFR